MTSRNLLLIAAGLAAGVLSGLLGVGGGIVLVPMLLLAGYTQHEAHATSLAAIIPIAAAGAITFAVAGEVDPWIAVALAGGSLLGAPLGAKIMLAARETTLRLSFGLLTIAIALRMLFA